MAINKETIHKVQPLFIKEGNEGFLLTFMITRGISEVKYKTDGTITVPADYILFRDAFLIHFSFFVPFLSPFSVFGHFVTLETRMVGRFLRENIVFNTIWQVIIVLVSK